jgi:hypothetical protein
MVRSMGALYWTIEEFATEGFTHIECRCPRCRVTRLRPMSWLPRISMGLTIAQLSEKAPVRGVRRASSIGQAVAFGRRHRQAVGAERMTIREKEAWRAKPPLHMCMPNTASRDRGNRNNAALQRDSGSAHISGAQTCGYRAGTLALHACCGFSQFDRHTPVFRAG